MSADSSIYLFICESLKAVVVSNWSVHGAAFPSTASQGLLLSNVIKGPELAGTVS